MARAYGRSSSADTAALMAIVILIITIFILCGIYILRQNGILKADTVSAENTIVSESVVTTVTDITETTQTITSVPLVTVTETSETSETTVPSVSEDTVTEDEMSDTGTSVSEKPANPAIPAPTEYDETFYEDFLMIGDSISVGLVNYGYLKPENVYAKVGYTPSSVMEKDEDDEEDLYTKAADTDPKYIGIMLGTNGLAYLSEDYMANKMGELIDSLVLTCPDAKIAVISIPPVTAEHAREKPENLMNISMYNAHIKRVAEEKSVLYVDTFSLLQGKSGYLADDYAENDGLHFKTAAYPVVLSAVQTAFTNEETDTAETEVPETETVTVIETYPLTETVSTVDILLP